MRSAVYRLVAATAALSAVLAWGMPARATPGGSTSESARADQLFKEGRAALEAGRYEEACPKLAESQRLDPGTGTLLALALCHESSGRTASAWRELTVVLEASQKRPDRAALAQKHLRALEPRLSRLTVSVADPASQSALHVRLDGADLPREQWGTAVPVDPGDHGIVATTLGQEPWKTTVSLGKDGDAKVAVVPRLDAAPSSAAVAPAPAEIATGRAPAGGGRGTVGWVVGGAGAVLVGVGGLVGVLALADHHSARSLCPMQTCSSSQGVADNNRAITEASISDFGVGIGLAAVAAGVFLLLRHHEPPPPPTALNVTPLVGPTAAGLSVHAAF